MAFALSCNSTNKKTRGISYLDNHCRWFEGIIPLGQSPHSKNFGGLQLLFFHRCWPKWISSHQPPEHLACSTLIPAWHWLCQKTNYSHAPRTMGSNPSTWTKMMTNMEKAHTTHVKVNETHVSKGKGKKKQNGMIKKVCPNLLWTKKW